MKKILLVEDDPFLIDIYTTKLKEVGFSVESVSKGKEALKKIKEEKIDLILLDIVLPEETGFSFLKKIKESPEFKEIPVIILSNLGQKREVEEGLHLGATKYLIKAHFTPSEVVEEIKQTLKQ